MEVSEMQVKDRPRERLYVLGARFLSDIELISILVGSGIKGRGVMAIAKEVLKNIDKSGCIPDIRSLNKIPGMGMARAAIISAAFEFSRRILKPTSAKICSPAQVIPLVQHYTDRKQEYFLCLSLNGANELLAIRIVSIGLVNRTIVHPREVFADPVTDRASSVICAHNHPSGNTYPSIEDRDVTKMLKQAGELLGIKLLDHIIFTKKDYFSFKEQKKL